mgnify:CR=1 FL=1
MSSFFSKLWVGINMGELEFLREFYSFVCEELDLRVMKLDSRFVLDKKELRTPSDKAAGDVSLFRLPTAVDVVYLKSNSKVKLLISISLYDFDDSGRGNVRLLMYDKNGHGESINDWLVYRETLSEVDSLNLNYFDRVNYRESIPEVLDCVFDPLQNEFKEVVEGTKEGLPYSIPKKDWRDGY